jgi:hypothetical protein
VEKKEVLFTMIPDVALGAPIAFPSLPFHFSHPVVNVKNFFYSFLTLPANKLESLSVENIYSIVKCLQVRLGAHPRGKYLRGTTLRLVTIIRLGCRGLQRKTPVYLLGPIL